MSNYRVVVTQNFFDQRTIDFLEQNACEVVRAELPKVGADRHLTHEDLCRLLAGADGWIVGHAQVTEALMMALPDLKVISRRGVGYDRVDTKAAEQLGRVVCIAAGGNDASVADHTIALMLAVAKRFRESQSNMAGGNWKILQGHDLYQKTVGIIGLGRIGKSVAKRLSGFEARVLTLADTSDRQFCDENNIECVDFETLVSASDYLTLHTPLTEETRFLINSDVLANMKPAAVLINTARGGLVDDEALLRALKTGQISGAGLDTFMSESDLGYTDVSKELLNLTNVVATPHAAASSVEGIERTNMVAARCVVDVLNGKNPPTECVVADGRHT